MSAQPNLPELSRYLLVDVGNSRLKWADAPPRGNILLEGEMPTEEATPERLAALAEQFADHFAVISSVVPQLFLPFSTAFPKRMSWVSASSPGLGLTFDYPKPAELGADRLAAAVAVHADRKFPAIIVQCGTATAFSVLDAQGRFCGGAIAPGLHTQLASLVGATAQLPKTELRLPPAALARSTEDAIRAGVLLNYQGGVKEILRTLLIGLPPSPHIVLTGGDAEYARGAITLPHTVRPLLVFEGLRIIGTGGFREPLLHVPE